jgi:hypothetical protein
VQKVYGDYDKSTIDRGRYSAGDQAELMTRSDADHGPDGPRIAWICARLFNDSAVQQAPFVHPSPQDDG